MSPIDLYFDQLKTGRSRWWHWIVGFVSIFVLFIAPFLILGFIAGAVGRDFIPLENPGTLSYFATNLAAFLPLFFGIWFVQKFWHRRSLTQLLTYTQKFRWRFFWNAVLAMTLVYTFQILGEYLLFRDNFKDVYLNPDFAIVVKGLLIVLALIPFQAAAEEFLLRGYLNQALIRYLKNPWVVFVLTSAVFALLHIVNPEAKGQEIPYLIAIFSFGFAACILLYYEGGLESAIGFHIANNIFAFSLFGYEDPDFPNIAVWNTGKPEIDFMGTLTDVFAIIMVVLLTLWLNRRVKFTPRGGLV